MSADQTEVSVSRRARLARPSSASSEKPDIQLLQEISLKLDRVVAVLACQGKEKPRQIEILAAAGCESAFIGSFVGMTASAVRKLQSRQREKAAQSVISASAPSE